VGGTATLGSFTISGTGVNVNYDSLRSLFRMRSARSLSARPREVSSLMRSITVRVRSRRMEAPGTEVTEECFTNL
jgi:hypothetical protein